MDIYQTKSRLLERISDDLAAAEAVLLLAKAYRVLCESEAVETHIELLIADEYLEDDTPGH